MTIHFCPKSAVFGLFIGVLCTLSAWYGVTLAGRAHITQALLSQAKCDPAGFVAITFTDSSQFTCAPAQYQPPTSRAEAVRRAKRGG